MCCSRSASRPPSKLLFDRARLARDVDLGNFVQIPNLLERERFDWYKPHGAIKNVEPKPLAVTVEAPFIEEQKQSAAI